MRRAGAYLVFGEEGVFFESLVQHRKVGFCESLRTYVGIEPTLEVNVINLK